MAAHPTPIGIPTLDKQHRAMAGMLRAFRKAIAQRRPGAEVRALVDHALAALCAHCRHEEVLMAESAYPHATAHRLDHERLVLAAVAFTEDAMHHRLPPEVLHEHGAVLRALFAAHMDRDDRALAGHLIRWGEGKPEINTPAKVEMAFRPIAAFPPPVPAHRVPKQ